MIAAGRRIVNAFFRFLHCFSIPESSRLYLVDLVIQSRYIQCPHFSPHRKIHKTHTPHGPLPRETSDLRDCPVSFPVFQVADRHSMSPPGSHLVSERSPRSESRQNVSMCRTVFQAKEAKHLRPAKKIAIIIPGIRQNSSPLGLAQGTPFPTRIASSPAGILFLIDAVLSWTPTTTLLYMQAAYPIKETPPCFSFRTSPCP